jgi:glycosyltransferase involved in cell wall biosynthesis
LPPPDAVLGYFLRPAGAAAAELGELWGRPAFVVIGEGDIVGHNRVAGDEENGAVARRLAGVVALNEGARSEVIERYRLDPSRVAVIPVGVDTSIFSPGDRMAARRRLDLAPEKFIVVFVGRLEHNKGSDRVAQAVDGLDDVTAIFVGPGRLARIQRNCLSVGPVPHDKVPEYLKAADAFVLPSLVEGVSNAVMEAMACGLPVIISEREFSRTVADDQAGIFVDPLAPEEIRRAIAALRDDPTRRGRMGSAAREQASRLASGQQAEIFVRWVDEMRRVKRDSDSNGR